MQGPHLTADLHHCRCAPQQLLDAALLAPACLDAVKACGLSPVQQWFHASPATSFGTGGVTATAQLAESHLYIHTWPEKRALTLDVYAFNFGADHSDKGTV